MQTQRKPTLPIQPAEAAELPKVPKVMNLEDPQDEGDGRDRRESKGGNNMQSNKSSSLKSHKATDASSANKKTSKKKTVKSSVKSRKATDSSSLKTKTSKKKTMSRSRSERSDKLVVVNADKESALKTENSSNSCKSTSSSNSSSGSTPVHPKDGASPKVDTPADGVSRESSRVALPTDHSKEEGASPNREVTELSTPAAAAAMTRETSWAALSTTHSPASIADEAEGRGRGSDEDGNDGSTVVSALEDEIVQLQEEDDHGSQPPESYPQSPRPLQDAAGAANDVTVSAMLVNERGHDVTVVPAMLFDENNPSNKPDSTNRTQRACLVALVVLAVGVAVGVTVAVLILVGGQSSSSSSSSSNGLNAEQQQQSSTDVAADTEGMTTPTPTASPARAPTNQPTVRSEPPTLQPVEQMAGQIDFSNGFACTEDDNGFTLNGDVGNVAFVPGEGSNSSGVCRLQMTRNAQHAATSAFLRVPLTLGTPFQMKATYTIRGTSRSTAGLAFVMHQDERGAHALAEAKGHGYFAGDNDEPRAIGPSVAVYMQQLRGRDVLGVATSGRHIRGVATPTRTDDEIQMGHLWVDYCPSTLLFDVYQDVAPRSEAGKKAQRSRLVFDTERLWILKDEDGSLPVYVGFTAGTTLYRDTIDVHSFSFVQGKLDGCE